MSGDRIAIDSSLVARLIATQFPEWADLPVRAVEPGGWDNRTFRLGDEMSVRLPSHPGYLPQVEKEHRWLPELAPQLPLPIPAPIAKGVPGDGYPLEWSIYRWLDGETATRERIGDEQLFARDLANFLTVLQGIDATHGPVAGAHNFFRGGSLAVYDGETRSSIADLSEEFDAVLATDLWDAALATSWTRSPVWVHGDVAFGNLLVQEGRLSAVIDFGSSGVGDPACDTTIAWTLLSGEGRESFKTALPLDPETWQRGRAWALWKGMKSIVIGIRDSDEAMANEWRRVVAAVLDEHRSGG